MEIHPLEAELFHGDRQDRAEIHFFCNFAKVPKNEQHKNGHMSSTVLKKKQPHTK